MTTTPHTSIARKNPDSLSTVARAIWQASHTLHRVHISKLGHSEIQIRPQGTKTGQYLFFVPDLPETPDASATDIGRILAGW